MHSSAAKRTWPAKNISPSSEITTASFFPVCQAEGRKSKCQQKKSAKARSNPEHLRSRFGFSPLNPAINLDFHEEITRNEVYPSTLVNCIQPFDLSSLNSGERFMPRSACDPVIQISIHRQKPVSRKPRDQYDMVTAARKSRPSPLNRSLIPSL